VTGTNAPAGGQKANSALFSGIFLSVRYQAGAFNIYYSHQFDCWPNAGRACKDSTIVCISWVASSTAGSKVLIYRSFATVVAWRDAGSAILSLPAPVQPKAGVVPANDRFRGDNDQRTLSVAPQVT